MAAEPIVTAHGCVIMAKCYALMGTAYLAYYGIIRKSPDVEATSGMRSIGLGLLGGAGMILGLSYLA